MSIKNDDDDDDDDCSSFFHKGGTVEAGAVAMWHVNISVDKTYRQRNIHVVKVNGGTRSVSTGAFGPCLCARAVCISLPNIARCKSLGHS